MTTPATYSNPAQEDKVSDDEKNTNFDIEKGVQSRIGSAHSDDRTLENERIGSTRNEQGGTTSNLVDWDGPDDPENPQNWTAKRKWGLIAALSAVTLITYVLSSAYSYHLTNGIQTTRILVLCTRRTPGDEKLP